MQSRQHAGAKTLASVLSLLFAGAVTSHAALISGTLRTKDGARAARVELTFVAPDGSERRALSGAFGRFEVDLPEGAYTVRAQNGFVIETEGGVPAAVQVTPTGATFDAILGPAPVREDVIVVASRVPVSRSSLGVATTVLTSDDLRSRAALSLADLLVEVPGFSVARSGGVGPVAGAFLRGGETRFTRVLIDGVAVNEPGGYFNFGTLLAGDLDRIEIVRGSVSTLYGSDALAGAVNLKPQALAKGVAGSVEAGSFDTRGGSLAAGRTLSRGWTVSATGSLFETANEQQNGTFESKAARVGIEREAAAGVSARAFFWAQDTSGGAPGQTLYGRPDLDARYERTLKVFGVEAARSAGALRTSARGSIRWDDQLSLNPLNSGSYVPSFGARRSSFAFSDFPNPLGYANETKRAFANAQVEGGASDHLFVAGIDLERETGTVGDLRSPLTLVEPRRDSVGLFAQDQWSLMTRLVASFGARVEKNDSTGTIVVPRGSFAWQLARDDDRQITLRASGGAGIKEPSFLESYGKQSFALGNPDLKAERSRTLDAGVDARTNRGRIEATVFRHDYRDQIAYKSLPGFRGTYENLARTEARGFEVFAEGLAGSRLRVFGHYTRTNAKVVASTSTSGLNAPGRPLLRRPKNQGSLTAEYRDTRALVALTWTAVGERADSDFSGLGIEKNEGYTRLDARARIVATRGLAVTGIVENLADREYQEVLGYPSLGRRARIQVSFSPER